MLARVFAQFNNLLTSVLLASAAVTIFLGYALDAVVIAAVVLINAAIGLIQEGRAEKSLEAIRAMLTRKSSVLRDGRRLTVPAESLVVGDVVLTEAGDRIPADLRLLRATSLKIEEAVLTGEAAASDKSIDPVAPDRARRPRLDGLFRHDGRERTRRRPGGRDGRRDRAWAHQRHGRGSRDTDHAAHPSDERFRRAPDDCLLALAACVCVFPSRRAAMKWHAFMAAVSVAVSAIPAACPR